MSTITALYFRNEQEDIAFIATDSLAVINDPIEKNGIIMPETICSFTSKTEYVPHLKTVISTFGTSLIGSRLRQFIDRKHALSGMDQLIYYIEMEFCSSMLADEEVSCLTVDEKNPNFLGLIFLTGYSDEIVYKEKGLIGKRTEPILLSYKLMVYKDHIVNCGTVNSLSEDYGGGYMYSLHPMLPEDVLNPFLNRLDVNLKMYGSIRTPSYVFIGDVFLEVHRQYNESGRKAIVGGGEIHVTSISIAKNDPQKPMIVSQFTLFRFPDFEQARKEIVQYHENSLIK